MDNYAENEPLGAGEVQASDQEQAMLEALVDEAMNMIHGQGASGDSISNMVLSANDVNEGIGKAVATVVIGVDKKVGRIPDELKIALAQEVLEEIVDLAIRAGALSEDEVTDQWLERVVGEIYSSYLSTKEAMGELDQNELQSSVDEAKRMMGQSDQSAPQNQAPGLLG